MLEPNLNTAQILKEIGLKVSLRSLGGPFSGFLGKVIVSDTLNYLGIKGFAGATIAAVKIGAFSGFSNSLVESIMDHIPLELGASPKVNYNLSLFTMLLTEATPIVAKFILNELTTLEISTEEALFSYLIGSLLSSSPITIPTIIASVFNYQNNYLKTASSLFFPKTLSNMLSQEELNVNRGILPS